MTKEQLTDLGNQLFNYAKKFNVPIEYLFEILEDQKVTPMIRGKAMEYNAFLLLHDLLPRNEWGVQKLNLNAQPGTTDEDISVTHRRTGIILKVESKSTVRGSISAGARKLKVPHFIVKSHRSRSNIKKAATSNDRYSVDSFDVIITNLSNAIYQRNTIGANLEIVHKEQLQTMLYKHYGVKEKYKLIEACENDWRFCIPEDIAEDGFIPRTPYVKLVNDENWRPIQEIEKRLLSVVKEKRDSTTSQKTRRS